MSDSIAAQLVCHDLPGLTTMCTYQPFKEPLCSSPISFGSEIHINDFTILIHRSPQVMLLAVDLYKDFIDEKSIAEALVLSFQAAGINGAEFYAP